MDNEPVFRIAPTDDNFDQNMAGARDWHARLHDLNDGSATDKGFLHRESVCVEWFELMLPSRWKIFFLPAS